jgi:hypothetical protein
VTRDDDDDDDDNNNKNYSCFQLLVGAAWSVLSCGWRRRPQHMAGTV